MLKTIIQKFKDLVMLIILIFALYCGYTLFYLYIELRDKVKDLEIQVIKFLLILFGAWISGFTIFICFKYFKDIFKAQSVVSKDSFANNKQFDSKKRVLELEDKLLQIEHKNKMVDLRRKQELEEEYNKLISQKHKKQITKDDEE